MMRAGAIEDYTYLWWDVRPHPNLGTVETRIFDQATRLEDTAAFAALTQSLCHRFAALFEEGEPLTEQPLGADRRQQGPRRRQRDGRRAGRLRPRGARRRPPTSPERLLGELADDAAELGCSDELHRVEEIIEVGTGATRQLAYLAEHGEDLASWSAPRWR